MKYCLITGGGSKFGQQLTENLIQLGYHVYLVTGSPQHWINNLQVTTIPVDWKTIGVKDIKRLLPKKPVDLIFFNHNASSLSQNKFKKNTIQNANDWQQSYFVACQLPFYLIHSMANCISPDTKIGWMLSNLISHPIDSQVGFADYIGNKFTNFCIMKSFALNFPAGFFGVNPEQIGCNPNLAKEIVDLIDNTSCQDLNGKIFYSDGRLFDM